MVHVPSEEEQERLNNARAAEHWIKATLLSTCDLWEPDFDGQIWTWRFRDRMSGREGALSLEHGAVLIDPALPDAALPIDWLATVLVETGGVLLKRDGTAEWRNPNTGETRPIRKRA
ncbi:MAG TPA: hypothetical protein VF092_21580 [Longimicrobium sp.]